MARATILPCCTLAFATHRHAQEGLQPYTPDLFRDIKFSAWTEREGEAGKRSVHGGREGGRDGRDDGSSGDGREGKGAMGNRCVGQEER